MRQKAKEGTSHALPTSTHRQRHLCAHTGTHTGTLHIYTQTKRKEQSKVLVKAPFSFLKYPGHWHTLTLNPYQNAKNESLSPVNICQLRSIDGSSVKFTKSWKYFFHSFFLVLGIWGPYTMELCPATLGFIGIFSSFFVWVVVVTVYFRQHNNNAHTQSQSLRPNTVLS